MYDTTVIVVYMYSVLCIYSGLLKSFAGYSLPDQTEFQTLLFIILYNYQSWDLLSLLVTLAVNLFWLSFGSICIYCNVVNILDWVVSLISSLENSFMVMHVEICMLGSLNVFCTLAKPALGIHSLGVLDRITVILQKR